MLTQDREIRQHLADKGVILKEHYTGSNKWDIDFGVASMAGLFDGWSAKPPYNLIELPSTQGSEGVKALVEELTTWHPETKGRTDTVLALWFAEIRARELCDTYFDKFHLDNPYLSSRAREDQVVIDLDELMTRRHQHSLN